MADDKPFRIDFIGIGTGKSGTTWLADMLRQHPDIYYPESRKELSYFNKFMPQDYETPNPDYNKQLDWYHHFFRNRNSGQICGEITPSYLSNENAAQDIYTYHPGIKIFCILRHPVERSYSEYLYSIQNGVSRADSFEKAIKLNPEKYLHTSLYYKNLQAFYKFFPPQNIGIFFFDDLKNDKLSFLNDIWRFLNVGPFIPENLQTEINTGMRAKNQYVNNFIGKAKMWLARNQLHWLRMIIEKCGLIHLARQIKTVNLIERTERDCMAGETRTMLCKYFETDIDALAELSNRDLTDWKK
jgi:hypothetical protein